MKPAYVPDPLEAIRFGFEWTEEKRGEARLVVVRAARGGKNDGDRELLIYTPVDQLQIHVTPTGRMRAFRSVAGFGRPRGELK